MIPLKVEFSRDGAKVFVKVLSQDESTRDKGEVFRSSEGFSLVSIGRQAVQSGLGDILYLRGWVKEYDTRWSFTEAAPSPQAAAEYIEKA